MAFNFSRNWPVLLVLVLMALCSSAQDTARQSLLRPSIERNPGKIWLITGLESGLYSAALVGLNAAWYSNFDQTSFHFFNDNKEWAQIDKTGHVLVPYFAGKWTYEMYKWAGVEKRKALWGGGMSGAIFLAGIEMLDGFSAKWGFSIGDFAANTGGALFFIAQEELWDEQRILLKFSSHPVNYDHLPVEAQERAEYLSGTNVAEHVLKDYNGYTFWASANISMFIKKKESRFPKWLNVAFGYGAENLLGGFDNTWCSDYSLHPNDCPHELITDFNYIPRYRQYYFSLDADLSRIPVKRKWAKVLLGVFNIVKLPFPALEIRSDGKLTFYPIYL